MEGTRPRDVRGMARYSPVATTPPADLEFKPDLAEAGRRWDAYSAGEIIDRPIVCVTAPRQGVERGPGTHYHDRVFLDIEEVVQRQLRALEATFFGGEAIPGLWLSCGPDEVAVFCGAELGWSKDSGDTNWSIPCIEDWAEASPIALDQDSLLYQGMLALYGRAPDAVVGKATLGMIDLHTNMDLVSAIRGPQRLCVDLLDSPEPSTARWRRRARCSRNCGTRCGKRVALPRWATAHRRHCSATSPAW